MSQVTVIRSVNALGWSLLVIVRLVSVHVTATTMVVGGIVLAAAGPALGVATASVGVGYLYAELSGERAVRQVGEYRYSGDGVVAEVEALGEAQRS